LSKRKDGSHTGNPIIKFRAKPNLKSSFEKECEKRGVTPADTLRQLTENFVKAGG